MAFCEGYNRFGGEAIEDESEFLQTVFDEEDAIFNEDAVANRKESSKCNNSKKNVRRNAVSTKREVWIVNPKIVAKRNLCSAEEAVDAKKNISPKENPYQEVTKAIKVEEDLSKRFKSRKKMGSLMTSKKKIKVNNNLINNNYCNFCGKGFCIEKLVKDHIQKCGCNENSLKECELCIEKFAKRSPLGFSWKLDHSYSKPDDDVLQCNLCGLNFSQTNHLQVHLRTKHVLQLREILKNCFHVETRNDLKEDNLIVQVLPEDRETKFKVETKDEILRHDMMMN